MAREGGGLSGQGSSGLWERLPAGSSTLSAPSGLDARALSGLGGLEPGKSAWRPKSNLGVMGCCCPHEAQPAVLLPKFVGAGLTVWSAQGPGGRRAALIPRPTWPQLQPL